MSRAAGVDLPVFRRVEPGPSFRVPVRYREFLAGSAHPSFPDTVPDIGAMIPTVLAQGVPALGPMLGAVTRDLVDAALPEHGGLLLRGLPLADKAGFEKLVASLGYDRAGYQGGIAVRKHESGVALNASQEDGRITLSPHNEMAYLPNYPRKVFFFCESAATEGGEVPINDIRQTVRLIPEPIRDRFRARGIRYHRRLAGVSSGSEMGWMDTFGTEDKAAVERHLTAAGQHYRWDEDAVLHYHYNRPAFVQHPETGEELWFNQVTELHCSYWRSHPQFPSDLADQQYPATTSYGDGEAIDVELISQLRGLLWQTTRAVRMSRGDVLVLDNQVLQHGRFAYQGTRRHFVSLAR